MQRLEGIANKTPVMTSRTLNQLTGHNVFVKAENFQRMGAFKFRGAYNAISQLTEEERERGVITHSSGNHAQAVALACKLLNIKATIVMPNNAPQVKKDATRGYGGTIIECEPTQEAREQTCQQLIDKHGYVFIHPYDNVKVIQGAGTVAMELVSQVGNLDAIIAPVGGGGLLSGTSAYSKLSGTISQVFGAEPKMADDAYRSFRSGTLLPQTNPQTIADGLRTSLSPLTFDLITKYVDDIITVSEKEIIDAMQFLWERMKLVVEPSGAVSLAALHKLEADSNLRIGLILSGGNVDIRNLMDGLRNDANLK
ncbi:MAG: pyridoxal-phosphate dependent enzyme [Methanobacteriota archaeon]|nr:MAG: pyridoxal-phosphate dependent enzyme [Euryarchaeota archaeon]